MKIEEIANREVLTQPVYQPGRPIEEVAAQLGLDPKTVLKLASNENAWGCSPAAREAASRALDQLALYPDGGSTFLRRKLAGMLSLEPSQLVVGQGSNEILELVGTVFLNPGIEAVMGAQSFIVYKLVTLLRGAKVVEVPLRDFTHDLEAMRAAVNERTRVVFLPSPNNPTGTANESDEIIAFAESLPDHVVFVFDEAYAEYQEEPTDLRPLIAAGRKILCTRSFSKIYGLAALRVGYGYGSTAMVNLLHQVRRPFNVDAVGLAAAEAALGDQEFVTHVRRETTRERESLAEWFKAEGLEVVPSRANFLLVRFADATAVNQALLERGVIVRPLQPYGLSDYLRITVGTPEQNERLRKTLRECPGVHP